MRCDLLRWSLVAVVAAVAVSVAAWELPAGQQAAAGSVRDVERGARPTAGERVSVGQLEVEQPAAGQQAGVAECRGWQERHPEWIFCDDFEDDSAMVRPGRYFEYGDDDGDFVRRVGVGVGGSAGMRVRWQRGEVGAGGMKISFGRNPNEYMSRSNIRTDEDFREIWYRMYLRMEPGWTGSPAKLSRATVFTSASDWRQAMIAHLWSDGKEHLGVDPASCVDEGNRVMCTKYNDFDRLQWLGFRAGTTPLFSTALSGRWFCVEAHVRLNDPGQANGLQEYYLDDRLEARSDRLDFVRGYADYAINAVFFENYWNAGSPREQERYFDNIVISEERVGCLDMDDTPTLTPAPSPATATPSETKPPPPTGTQAPQPTDTQAPLPTASQTPTRVVSGTPAPGSVLFMPMALNGE